MMTGRICGSEPEDRSGLIDDSYGPTCDRDYSYDD
jgi:hypothetical protein